jgi:hypothetical protein
MSVQASADRYQCIAVVASGLPTGFSQSRARELQYGRDASHLINPADAAGHGQHREFCFTRDPAHGHRQHEGREALSSCISMAMRMSDACVPTLARIAAVPSPLIAR